MISLFKRFSIFLIMLFIFSLIACSNTQPEQHSSPAEPYLHLSTKNGETERDQQDIGQPGGAAPLSFDDFKERWNALTEEQLSTLYINKLEQVSTNDGSIYRAPFNEKLELLIFVLNGKVRQLEMISLGRSSDDIFTMLSGWSQMVNILHPNQEGQDVDSLFHSIGVGPNGDLTNVKAKSFKYFDMNYEVVPTDKGYTLRISYVQQP